MDGAERHLRDDAGVQRLALRGRPGLRGDLVFGFDVPVLELLRYDVERGEVHLDHELAGLRYVGDLVLLGEGVGVLAGGKHKRAVGDERFWIALLIALTEGVDLGVLCGYALSLSLDLLLVLGFGLCQCGRALALCLLVLGGLLGVALFGFFQRLCVLGLGARNELLQDAKGGRRFRDGGREWRGQLAGFEGKRRGLLLERLEVDCVVECQRRCQQSFEARDGRGELVGELVGLCGALLEVLPLALFLVVGTLPGRLSLSSCTLALEGARCALGISSPALGFTLHLYPNATTCHPRLPASCLAWCLRCLANGLCSISTLGTIRLSEYGPKDTGQREHSAS